MSRKLTYKELEQRIKELEREVKQVSQPKNENIAIFENSPEAIVILDPKGCVLNVNTKLFDWLKYKPEELIGKNLMELPFFSKDAKAKIMDKFAKRMQGKRVPPYDLEFIIKNGKQRIGRVVAKPIRDESGKIIKDLIMISDITEMKRAEEALQQSEERFRSIAENSLEWIWEVDTSGKYTYSSPKVEQILGYKPEEVMEKHFYDLFHPEKREELKKSAFEVFAQKQPFREYMNRNVHKNGKTVWLSTSGVPILDERGNLLGYRGTDTDITERKRAEQELKNTSALLNATLNGIPDVIGIQGLNHEIIRYNDSGYSFLNISPEEARGKKCYELIGRIKPCEICATSKCYKSKKPEQIEKFVEPMGIWMDCRSYPLLDKSGNIVNVIEHLRDITERKKAHEALKQSEEQLHQAQKLEGIGQLAGGIAHDLNNILTAIIINIELALGGLKKSNKIYSKLEQVMLNGMRAGELVQKILAFSRRQIIYPKVINVNSTILNLAKTLKRMIREDIKIEMNSQDNISPIKADTTQLEQIFINLIVNARDAINQKKNRVIEKVITIKIAETFLDKEFVSSHVGSTIGQHVLISVSDNGIGMDKEILNRIFEPFFTTKELGKGTGLGLSTVYGIVKQNNGSIYVYSKPGEGTTIKIYWPAFMTKTKLKEKVKEEKVKGGSETILFVEDDDRIRKASEQLLVIYGYKVLLAKNGRHALDLVNKYENIKIEMLVTDVVMPEMGGIELSEKLTEIYPELKVLYCSGYSDNHITSQSGILKKGVDFLSKPYQGEGLAKKIREILDKK